MNKNYVLWHLEEAQKAIREIVAEIKSDPDYDYGNYLVDIAHAYHHLNTAWNARDASEAAVEACTDDDWYRWRQFPTDIYLGP